ncbi:uncharacterized protein BXIN_1073 [Babesia sp. Xinjiang]|uniref:uncharacterized protein n=1 Tax=Babesia sp. Xinjiang TaxID=462227 RepID=UPI000A255EB1|nr:uncharacterized protein BXIN_1073 [Babesia sp. Xinjiang]ORM41974.1 hypothetical protein BXIN_1073 [Babesia sp. Xinjiang]
MPLTDDSGGLMKIGNLLDQQLSVSHLSRHEMLLFITNGPHGRTIPGTSERQYISNSRSWVPSGLNQAVRNKMQEAVKTVDVVTTEDSMQTFSVFLMEIANQPYSALSIKDTLLARLIHNRAKCVIVLFDYRFAKSNELLTHMETVATVVESGHLDKLHLFVSFDEEAGSEEKVKEALGHFDDALHAAFHGREYENELFSLKFQPLKVPSDARLVAHLLGGNEKLVASFLSEIRKHTFDFDNMFQDTDDISESDRGVETLRVILDDVRHRKLNSSVEKLERDVDLLYSVSSRHMREDRSKEITNIIASCHGEDRFLQPPW